MDVGRGRALRGRADHDDVVAERAPDHDRHQPHLDVRACDHDQAVPDLDQAVADVALVTLDGSVADVARDALDRDAAGQADPPASGPGQPAGR